jgi:arylsulfatase
VRQHLNPGPRQTNAPPPTTELYDLAKDPRESTDVSAQHPEVVKKLSALAREQHVPSKLWPIRTLDAKQ